MQAMDTTEDAAPQHRAVLGHPLDVGSPAAVVLEASQDPTDHPSHEAVDTDMPDVAKVYPLEKVLSTLMSDS